MKICVSKTLWVSWLSISRRGTESTSHPSAPVSRAFTSFTSSSRGTSLSSHKTNAEPGSSNIDCHHVTKDYSMTSIAKEAFSILAKRNKTWKRLRHLVDLAQLQLQHSNNGKVLHANNTNTNHVSAPKQQHTQYTVVDIGTDHGILPIALASTKQFHKVTGIDISEQVIRDGAVALYQDVQDHLDSTALTSTGQTGSTSSHDSRQLSVTFRHGDGLSSVDPGDADIVCVAGMGVHSMLKILSISEVERVGCQILLLQPTSSRPKHLMLLYETLQQSGWCLVDERIENVSSRWYLSVSFSKNIVSEVDGSQPEHDSMSSSGQKHQVAVPGTRLYVLENDNPMRVTFEDYVNHHCSWLKADHAYAEGLEETELRWMKTFCRL